MATPETPVKFYSKPTLDIEILDICLNKCLENKISETAKMLLIQHLLMLAIQSVVLQQQSYFAVKQKWNRYNAAFPHISSQVLNWKTDTIRIPTIQFNLMSWSFKGPVHMNKERVREKAVAHFKSPQDLLQIFLGTLFVFVAKISSNKDPI